MLCKKTSRVYFNKDLTTHKANELRDLFAEMNKARDFIAEHFSEFESKFLTRMATFKRNFDRKERDDLYDLYKLTGGCCSYYLFSIVYSEYVSNLANWTHKTVDSLLNSKVITNIKSPIVNRGRFVLTNTYADDYTSVLCLYFEKAISTVLFDAHITLSNLRTDKSEDYSIDIPLKLHKQFKDLANRGNLTTRFVLTDKYIEFTFEVYIEKTNSIDGRGSITIDKKGNLLFSDGTKFKVNTSLFEKLETMNPNSVEYKRIISSIKTELRHSLNEHKIKVLNSLMLEYKAVGKYYFACETIKRLLKSFCRANRVCFIDTYTRKAKKLPKSSMSISLSGSEYHKFHKLLNDLIDRKVDMYDYDGRRLLCSSWDYKTPTKA